MDPSEDGDAGGHVLRSATVLGSSLRFMREAFDETEEPPWRSGGVAIEASS